MLVVGKHHDTRPVAIMDFWMMAELAQLAGMIGVVEVGDSDETIAHDWSGYHKRRDKAYRKRKEST